MQANTLRISAIAALALLCLPACSTTTFKVPISVDPKTARVYINGRLAGQGDRFVYDVDFGNNERICIQAAAKGYAVLTLQLTREQLMDQLNQFGDIQRTLRQERR